MNINKFCNVTEIGHGGMGTVYSGFYDGHKVAIKKFREEFTSDIELVRRFQLEAQTLQKLKHPSIVKIIEPSYDTNNRFYPAFEENGNLYMAMEFVEGETIEHYIRNHGKPLSEERAIALMNKILDAMEYVRQKGIIHRDIKPSNIIVRPDNESICIIDFGIVKDINSSGMTVGRCILGTDGYMSPEQANGLTVDCRTDIYSLGCLLFYMLTGTHAIHKKASDHETRMSIIRDEFPRAKDINSNISDHIQAVIDKAVNKNMLLRFQSPKEFKMELNMSNPTRSMSATESNRSVTISVGRDQNCDITIYDSLEKISRHHLDITYYADTQEFEISDRSTNGTEINGKFIHNSTYKLYFPYDWYVLHSDNMPNIILAQTQTLGWDNVLDIMGKKVNPMHDILDPIVVVDKSDMPAHKPDKEEKLSFGYGILSFLFPIVGWVLYYQWKQSKPVKAKQASRVAWLGFIAGLILNFISARY